MRRIGCFGVLGLAGVVSACGGSAPPAATAGEASVEAVGGGDTAETSAPLTPVEAPKDVVLVGRLANPAQLIMLGQQLGFGDLIAGLEAEAPGFSKLVDLNAPIEAMVQLADGPVSRKPKFTGFVSVGITSLEPLLASAPRRGGSDVIPVGDDCVAARSLGASKARLVCSKDRKAAESMVGYATRWLPLAELGNDLLRVTVSLDPLRDRYKNLKGYASMAVPFIREELNTGFEPFDRAVADAATALVDEALALFDDVSGVSLVGNLGDRQSVRLTGELSFQSKSSWTATELEKAGSRATEAPPLFWDLPAASTVGSFSAAGDPKSIEKLQRSLVELLDTYLTHQQLAVAPRKKLVALVEKLWTPAGPSVYASGLVTPQTPKAGLERHEELRVGLGWHLVGLSEGPTRLVSYLDSVAQAVSDPVVRRQLGELSTPAAVPTMRRRAALPAMPRGSVVYELVLPGALIDITPAINPLGDAAQPPQVKSPALTIYIAVAPDGELTWSGVSADGAALAKQLTEAVAGGGLKERPGLEALRGTRVTGGGFTRVEQALSVKKLVDAGLSPSRLPHQGAFPLVYTTSVRGGAGPTLVVDLHGSKELVVDLAAVANLILKAPATAAHP